jgi:hypothetical protein
MFAERLWEENTITEMSSRVIKAKLTHGISPILFKVGSNRQFNSSVLKKQSGFDQPYNLRIYVCLSDCYYLYCYIFEAIWSELTSMSLNIILSI